MRLLALLFAVGSALHVARSDPNEQAQFADLANYTEAADATDAKDEDAVADVTKDAKDAAIQDVGETATEEEVADQTPAGETPTPAVAEETAPEVEEVDTAVNVTEVAVNATINSDPLDDDMNAALANLENTLDGPKCPTKVYLGMDQYARVFRNKLGRCSMNMKLVEQIVTVPKKAKDHKALFVNQNRVMAQTINAKLNTVIRKIAAQRQVRARNVNQGKALQRQIIRLRNREKKEEAKATVVRRNLGKLRTKFYAARAKLNNAMSDVRRALLRLRNARVLGNQPNMNRYVGRAQAKMAQYMNRRIAKLNTQQRFLRNKLAQCSNKFTQNAQKLRRAKIAIEQVIARYQRQRRQKENRRMYHNKQAAKAGAKIKKWSRCRVSIPRIRNWFNAGARRVSAYLQQLETTMKQIARLVRNELERHPMTVGKMLLQLDGDDSNSTDSTVTVSETLAQDDTASLANLGDLADLDAGAEATAAGTPQGEIRKEITKAKRAMNKHIAKLNRQVKAAENKYKKAGLEITANYRTRMGLMKNPAVKRHLAEAEKELNTLFKMFKQVKGGKVGDRCLNRRVRIASTRVKNFLRKIRTIMNRFVARFPRQKPIRYEWLRQKFRANDCPPSPANGGRMIKINYRKMANVKPMRPVRNAIANIMRQCNSVNRNMNILDLRLKKAADMNQDRAIRMLKNWCKTKNTKGKTATAKLCGAAKTLRENKAKIAKTKNDLRRMHQKLNRLARDRAKQVRDRTNTRNRYDRYTARITRAKAQLNSPDALTKKLIANPKDKAGVKTRCWSPGNQGVKKPGKATIMRVKAKGIKLNCWPRGVGRVEAWIGRGLSIQQCAARAFDMGAITFLYDSGVNRGGWHKACWAKFAGWQCRQATNAQNNWYIYYVNKGAVMQKVKRSFCADNIYKSQAKSMDQCWQQAKKARQTFFTWGQYNGKNWCGIVRTQHGRMKCNKWAGAGDAVWNGRRVPASMGTYRVLNKPNFLRAAIKNNFLQMGNATEEATEEDSQTEESDAQDEGDAQQDAKDDDAEYEHQVKQAADVEDVSDDADLEEHADADAEQAQEGDEAQEDLSLNLDGHTFESEAEAAESGAHCDFKPATEPPTPSSKDIPNDNQ